MIPVIMIIGGAYQGKKDYAVRNYNLCESDMLDGKICSISDLLTAKCIHNFHYLTKRYENEDIKKALSKNPDIIIIADIIGEGIIPVEKSGRIWRENTGKLCCFIAEKSHAVIRVSCGIGQIIKNMKIIFIRHGMTYGNLEKRYIGITDENLCDTGIKEISGKKYPECDIIISSPMKRCIQTADIIYPDKEKCICRDLRETDFGDFEGKNYTELKKNPDYQKWLDSNGMTDFPDGEPLDIFKTRCCNAFMDTVRKYNSSVAFVVHGGVIMSILEKYGFPRKSFYDYHVPNGGGYITDFDGKYLRIRERL